MVVSVGVWVDVGRVERLRKFVPFSAFEGGWQYRGSIGSDAMDQSVEFDP